MFLAELICVFFAKQFDVELHWNTVWVVTIGLSVFTVIAFLFQSSKTPKRMIEKNLSYIHLSGYISAIIVLCQIVYILLFIRYMNNIATAYQGYSEGLMANINLYDRLNKFDFSTLQSLHINPGVIYKITRIVSLSLPYSLLYVFINNYCCAKKISILQGVSVILLCVSIVLSGSRSPLLRVVTMAVILIYFFKLRYTAMRKNQLKIILKGIVAVAVLAVFFLLIQFRPDGT